MTLFCSMRKSQDLNYQEVAKNSLSGQLIGFLTQKPAPTIIINIYPNFSARLTDHPVEPQVLVSQMKATSYLPPPATAWAILFRSMLNHSIQLLLARSYGYMQMKSFQLLLPLCKPILDNFSVQSYCMSPTECSGILIPSPRNHALVSQVFATFSKSILRELLFQFIQSQRDLPPLLPEHFIFCYLSPCTFQFFSLRLI